MAYFTGHFLKRSVEKSSPLVTFVTEIPIVRYKPQTTLSYVEYEDVGYYDNRILFFTIFAYMRNKHKCEAVQKVGVPLSLFLEFAKTLRAYAPDQDKSRELGTLCEFPGGNVRIIVTQQKNKFLLRRQFYRSGIWNDTSTIPFNQDQIPALKCCIKHFGISHQKEIITSMERVKNKKSKWESTPPIR